MKEEIRVIPWTNGEYGVSNLGNVYSFYNTQGNKLKEPRILSKQVCGSGYCRVLLTINGRTQRKSVHRLVAEMFIPNPKHLKYVNHKDENPLNNCVDNLEWCTFEYNCNYGTRNKRISDGNKKKVIQLSETGSVIKIFDSCTDAANEFNISHCRASLILRGKKKNKYNIHYA